ncbi:MAG: hypothetical protein U0325_09820 [Polyangiales bacterium]
MRSLPSAEALARLGRAYNASPNDVEIGVLYVEGLTREGQHEMALAVASRLNAFAPRHAALAFHHAATSPRLRPGEADLPLVWLLATRPEARAGTTAVCALLDDGRVHEADEALAFGRRLGIPDLALATPESMVALARGDPSRIERATRALEGAPQSWTQRTGVRLRVAGLMVRGQAAEAGAYLARQVTLRRAAGDDVEALMLAGYQLELARLTGVPGLDEDALAGLDRAAVRTEVPLRIGLRYRSERAARRSGTVGEAAAALAELDHALLLRAGASAADIDSARLATLAVAARVGGDAEVARRWRTAVMATRGAREAAAYDVGHALERLGSLEEAVTAYRLAMSAHEIERHAFAAVASRVRLAALLERLGRDAEAAPLRAFVARAWRDADPAALSAR